MLNDTLTRRHVSATSSWAVIGLLLAMPTAAVAQTTAPAGSVEAAPSSGQAVEETDADANAIDEASADEIVVVGSRASQRSANDRKRNAKTATDSIVADDIGSFPDRNVAEAISRVPGVALTRADNGEGEGVSLRGNGPDLTRVELDGVGVQSTTGLSINSDGARSADLRELPADLVKSIDVVKGSTADMTEGGLGGSIQIKTRTGLDFSKPYFSLSAGASQNSLGREWQPNFNGVASRKFLDNRLGLIVSGSYSKLQNNAHAYEQTTSNNRNYARDIDFDNSPEKTFEYNLATLGGDTADVLFANSIETPRTLLTKSIAAKSKAECFTLFPHNPTGNAPGTTGTTLNNQKAQRILEQQTCLNQWNDTTPSLLRHFMTEDHDERYAIDARLDYQLLDDLTVFVKGTFSGRNLRNQQRTRGPVSVPTDTGAKNVTGTFVDTTTGYPRIRSVSPTAPAGYYLYDGLSNVSNNAVLGTVTNVVPSSVVVDENHNVTTMTLTNNTIGIDQLENQSVTRTKFVQTGFEYNGDRLDIEGFAGLTTARALREDRRTSRNAFVGDATLTVQENGLWDIEYPSGFDDTDIDNFVQLRQVPCASGGTNPATCVGQAAVTASINGPASPAYTPLQLPLVTPSFGASYSPLLGESSERLAKLDLAYKTEGLIPFITRVKIGGQYRNNKLDRWGNGGYIVKDAIGTFGQAGYQAPIVVPTLGLRGTYRACQPTATSIVPCNYGYVPNTGITNTNTTLYGVDTFTPDQLRALFQATIEPADGEYFGDLPNRGNLPSAWNGLRTDILFDSLGQSVNMNIDCIKECRANDGNVYPQQVTQTNETVKNIYAMAEFEQELPFGLLFNGNVGVRGVFTKTQGTGVLQLSSIRINTPVTLPPTTTTTTVRQNVTLSGNTTDWLPTANLNLWGFDEKVVLRLYGGKTVARPQISRLIPAGNCTISQLIIEDDNGEDVFGCGGRIGNPALKPFTAWNYNASVEWYPNRDTVLSATYGKLDVKIGNSIGVTRNYYPFAGSDVTDPVTGQPLSELEFSVPTYENGPGYKRNIWEFQAKTAFTFLPWFLKYTGADVNYSRLASSADTGTQDPLSGDIMPPPDESKDYWNASVWYDDGKLNLRFAYQKRSETFLCITPCGNNNISFNYPSAVNQDNNTRLAYNPGIPRFREGTTFMDAKASYNINRNFQVFIEGRNLGRESTQITSGGYDNFSSGAPKVFKLAYGGRRILVGARVQFGSPR